MMLESLEKIMDSLDNMTYYKTNNSKTLSSYDNTVSIFQTDHIMMKHQ